jgi:N-acetylneuraminic acid mutarotase
MAKKTILLFILFITYLTTTAQTKLKFKDMPDMPTARAGISTTSDKNSIYVTCGFAARSYGTSMIEKYDIKNNIWTVLTNSLAPKRYCSSVIIGNNLYVFNGQDEKAYNNKVEVVNLNNGSITFTKDNPLPRRIGGAAAWNGSIYVFGGAISTEINKGFPKHVYTNKLYKFDTSTQEWEELASMPEAKETQGEIINGKLYVIGGFNGKVSNRVNMYDIYTNTWTDLGTIPDSLSAHALVSSGNKIYIVGDYTKLTTVACYDVSTRTYTRFDNNMVKRRHAGIEIVDGKLYVMGGNQAADNKTLLNSFQITNLPE